MSQRRSPRGEPRFPCSVVYIRFNWADAEPEQGRYNWKLIDDVIAAWKPRGATVAMRVMTCSAHSAGYYTSPKWLFDAGCKSFDYVRGGDDPTSGGKRIPRIEPDYSDPLYLKHHGAFLSELGKRYDGSPAVEFLDIGSYGIWGEWHTSNAAPVEVRKQIVDLYLAAFKKTPLVFIDRRPVLLSPKDREALRDFKKRMLEGGERIHAPEQRAGHKFYWCVPCRKLYWTGSHAQDLANRLKKGIKRSLVSGGRLR
jgi:hypothetical protein